MDPALPIVINCAVCNELFHADPPATEGESDRRPRLLPCAHVYCTSCAEQLVQSSPLCRVCQKPHGASTLDGIPLHTALIDWTKRLVQQMKDAMQAKQQQQAQDEPAGGGGDLSDSGVLYNSVNSAAGMPSLDPPPPSSFPALPTLNFSMDAGGDEDEEMDGPQLGQPASSAAAGGSAAAAAASAANAGQFYAFAGAPGSVTPGAALSNPLVRPMRGARRIAQSMNPQRKVLELSALGEIGFEQQPITDDDLHGLGTPQFINNLPLLRQWLTKLHLEHPEKRRKQTVKNEFTGSALVQSLNAIFACACNRIKYGQKQKAMQHVVNKHSESAIAAAMASERTAVPGRHVGGSSGAAAGSSSLQSPSHHHGHVAMTAAETAAWQKSLLQQAGSSDAADMPALSSLAAPHAAAAAATPGGLHLSVPVPLLAPSSTDAVPKSEPGSGDKAEPMETSESGAEGAAAAAPAERPPVPLASVILADDTIWLQRGFVSVAPTSADWNRLTQSWRIALVSEHLTKMICVDEEKRRSWDANLQLAAVMGSEPAQLALTASAATKDLTAVFSCKCRGVAWGKRSEAFSHIAAAHSHTADARKQSQQQHYTTVPYVPPAGTAAAALAAATAGVPTAAAATPAAVCAQCGSTGEELLQCSACLQTVYCSPVCQRTHWKAHKTDCKRIQAAKAAGLPVPPSASSPAGAGAAGAPSPNPGPRVRDNGYRSRYELLAQVADLTESQRVLQTSMVRLAAEMTQWRDAAQALRKEREIAQNSDYVDVANGQAGFAAAASSSSAAVAAASSAPSSSGGPVVKSEHAAPAASTDEVSMLRAQNSRLREELSFVRTSHVAALEKRLREWETAFGSMLPAEAHRMQQEQIQAQADELRRSLTAEFQAKLRNLTDGLFTAASFGSPSSAVSATAAAIAAASAAAAAPHTPAATRTRPSGAGDAGESHESAAEEDEEKHGVGADAPPPLWGANGQQQQPQANAASHKRSAPEPDSHADNDDASHTDDEPEEPLQQVAPKPAHAAKKRRSSKH